LSQSSRDWQPNCAQPSVVATARRLFEDAMVVVVESPID
jgi:hypothetical protein